MAAPSRSKMSPAKMRDAFIQDCAACWIASRENRPNETPYAFIIYGVEDSPRLIPYVLTEERLNEVARKYVKEGFHDTVAEACKALRYSVEDAPHFLAETQGVTPTVDSLLAPHHAELHDPINLKLIVNSATEALASLDKAGTFGKPAERARMILGVIIENANDDVAQKSIKKLNSAAAWKRFQDQTRIEGQYRSCDHLALSPDGNSIYREGSRPKENQKRKGDDDSVAEIVAYDRSGMKLSQRWILSHRHFGETTRGLVVGHDGKWLYWLHGKYQGASCKTYVTRLACKDGKPGGEANLDGEPGWFAVSSDASRIALVAQKQTIHLLDGQLNIVQLISFDSHPRNCLFLRSGELLIATGTGVQQLAAMATKPKLVIPNDAFRLSIDGNEKLLAVSRWFPSGGRNVQKEFGLQLYQLPKMKLPTTFSIKNHQLVTGTLSPDGRLLACEAADLSSRGPHSIVVFETATGREVGRRKGFDFVGDIAFCPDSRTLVIPKKGSMESEPIAFWRLPDR
jgi:Domain of unknown function (DUF4303)